jgi:putative ubiquitin-RnfH superfamily antitoxin RatB of RatAB toxin-antitoxin module
LKELFDFISNKLGIFNETWRNNYENLKQSENIEILIGSLD